LKLTLENTSQIVMLSHESAPNVEIPARVWEGTTESGIKVQCLITRVSAAADQDLTQFDKELREVRPPSVDAVRCFPLRLIL
jgi:hypothetical protein